MARFGPACRERLTLEERPRQVPEGDHAGPRAACDDREVAKAAGKHAREGLAGGRVGSWTTPVLPRVSAVGVAPEDSGFDPNDATPPGLKNGVSA